DIRHPEKQVIYFKNRSKTSVWKKEDM
ncbi:hypothetical protein CapIbe_007436, partial [Capra ibex]